MGCESFCFKEGEDRKQKEKELREALQALETKYSSQQIVPVVGRCGNAQVSPLYRSDRCHISLIYNVTHVSLIFNSDRCPL